MTIRRIWAKAAKGTKANTTIVTASTGTVDRDGDILAQDTWQLDSYKSNPVIPWNHDYSVPPVGRALSVEAKDGALTAEIEWDTKTELGATVARQFADGFLGAVSVGFIAHDRKARRDLDADDPAKAERGSKLSGLELLEISAVVVPANPEALAAKAAKARRAKAAADIRDAVLELIRTDSEIRAALGMGADDDDEKPEGDDDPTTDMPPDEDEDEEEGDEDEPSEDEEPKGLRAMFRRRAVTR